MAIIIDQGAHHLDLRGPDAADPQSVINARLTEIQLLHKWLNIWEEKNEILLII